MANWWAIALVDGVLAVRWSLVRRRRGRFPRGVFLAGLVGIAAGVLALLWSGLTALALFYLVAAWAIVRGVFEMIAAFHLRLEIDNEWLLALSVLSVLLGVILAAAPEEGALALLRWIGSFAIVVGVLTIFLGVRLRRIGSQLHDL